MTTRVFSRVYIMLHPFIMGPYYAYIGGAGQAQGAQTNYAFAVMLAVFTTFALSALFNIRYALEDPFSGDGLDSINVRRDMGENAHLLRQTASGGPLFDDATGSKMPPSVLASIHVTS